MKIRFIFYLKLYNPGAFWVWYDHGGGSIWAAAAAADDADDDDDDDDVTGSRNCCSDQ